MERYERKYGRNKKCMRIGVGPLPLRFCKDPDDQIRLKNPLTND